MHAFLAALSLILSSPGGMGPDRTIVVNPGQSIQAAVDRARPGDTIRVRSGTYHEQGRPCPYQPTAMCAVVISIDHLSLIADVVNGQPVVVDDPTGLDSGIVVGKNYAYHCEKTGPNRLQGSRIIGFTVKGFKGSGIILQCVDDWEVAYNTAEGNAVYGLYPTKVGPGRMHHNVASGAHDTGIYIGQSKFAHVDHNISYDNVSGFEIENSVGIQMDHNTAFHNTAGFLEFILPHLDVMENHDNVMADNFSYDNNHKNTCLDPTDPVCKVPPGTGMAMVAGEHNQTLHNTVIGNKTYGVALADFCTAFGLTPPQCKGLGFNVNPRGFKIEYNTARLNRTDLLWTGRGTGNCWLDNHATIVVPAKLPVC